MNLDQLMEDAYCFPTKVVAVAVADNVEVIESVVLAVKQQLATFVLFGNKQKIELLLSNLTERNNDQFITVVNASSDKEACRLAVQRVYEGRADVLMKGMVSTSVILKEVLHKDYGLRKGNVLSHVAVFQVPGYHRLLLVTDAAMNIDPDLSQKVEILINAVEVAHKLGIHTPKVAVISAVETVNSAMGATIDGALLTQMNRRGQIKHCLVDGPLALDNAISNQAAEIKGIKGDVAGRADILLVPTVEVGNVLYKSLIYFAKAKVGAIIAGAKAPIVLTSRADSTENRLFSLAIAVQSVR